MSFYPPLTLQIARMKIILSTVSLSIHGFYPADSLIYMFKSMCQPKTISIQVGKTFP